MDKSTECNLDLNQQKIPGVHKISGRDFLPTVLYDNKSIKLNERCGDKAVTKRFSEFETVTSGISNFAHYLTNLKIYISMMLCRILTWLISQLYSLYSASRVSCLSSLSQSMRIREASSGLKVVLTTSGGKKTNEIYKEVKYRQSVMQFRTMNGK